MFEEIFFPKTAEQYRAGPLAEQRERYLVHLAGLGSTRRTLRKCASDQLRLVRLLNLRGDDQVSIHRIEAAAIIWSGPKGRRCKRPASSKARARFVSRGVQWLRFLGWLDEPERERHPHHGEVAIFEKWLREERGLSDATIRPVGRKTLGKIVSDRLAGIGIVTGRRGTHALRHAAAQHLLDQGISMKVIGDFLGHRDPSSTAIYAKVNLAALREVAALDLEGLA
jgi:hypothetical protein